MADMLEIPALGRPFRLGSLYDRRRDALFPGVSLWDQDVLQRNRLMTAQTNVQCDFMGGTAFNDACEAFNIDAELSLSVLCGLVSVSGSADYLNRKHTSEQSNMVSVKYYETSTFEEIDMKEMTNITHKQILEDCDYTHVVTGIQKGAQAVFLFESHHSRAEDSKQLGVNLRTHVNEVFFAGTGVDAGGGTKQTSNNTEVAKRVYCTYFGDIKLEKNPTTLQDAVEAYKTLPTICKDELAVPVKVWLYPLCKFKQCTYIYKGIPGTDAKKLEHILNALANILADTESLQKQYQRVYNNGLGPTADMKSFYQLTTDYADNFKLKIKDLVCAVRNNEQDNDTLRSLICEVGESPYNPEKLQAWLRKVDRVSERLEGHLQPLSCGRVEITGNLQSVINANSDVICLTFEAGKFVDPQVEKMKAYSVSHRQTSPGCTSAECANDEADGDAGIDTESAAEIQLFLSFVETNKLREHVKFVVLVKNGATASDKFETSVYKRGKLIHKQFNPPSKPRNLQAPDMDQQTVTLEWTKPEAGDEFITKYRIEYRKVKETVWHKIYTDGSQTRYTVKGLGADKAYMFRVAGCCVVGRTGNSNELKVKTPWIFGDGEVDENPTDRMPTSLKDIPTLPDGY